MTCQARTGSDGQIRCAACRIVVDADETIQCPRETWTVAPAIAPVEPTGFISGLPEHFLPAQR